MPLVALPAGTSTAGGILQAGAYQQAVHWSHVAQLSGSASKQANLQPAWEPLVTGRQGFVSANNDVGISCRALRQHPSTVGQ